MKALAVFLSVILIADCVSAQSIQAETDESDRTAQRTGESLRLASEEVKRFAYSFASDPHKELKLHPAPIVRYGNYDAESYSTAFIWTYQGRPEAIASVTNWYLPRRYHGLAVTSLSSEKLIGTRDGMEIWHPQEAGVALRPIPDAGAPGESAVQRLREMRALAREFTADFKRVGRYLENGKLRLLSTPLYRYESAESGIIDGAIFGMAFGTAPQLVLLIEARQTRSGSRWEYAVAPRNSMEYHVRHKGRDVWSLPQLAPPWPDSKIPTNTYTVFPDLQREGRTEEFVQELLRASQTNNDR